MPTQADNWRGQRAMLNTSTQQQDFNISSLNNRPLSLSPLLRKPKSDGSLTTLVEGRNRDGVHDWWLDDSESGIIRFHRAIGIDAKQLFKITYTAGRTAPPIEAKMATIMLVIRQAARAALNDENCAERIKRCGGRCLHRQKVNTVRCSTV